MDLLLIKMVNSIVKRSAMADNKSVECVKGHTTTTTTTTNYRV